MIWWIKVRLAYTAMRVARLFFRGNIGRSYS